ncbi:MAG: hypothetical protein U5N53_34130 [Mycobacterium sp.]|nr:hypothetical protein [Mycobacterium sp.]
MIPKSCLAASIFRRNDYRLHLAGIDAPVDELRSAAMEKLSAFKVPTVWSILDSEDPVPFGATGKPDIHRIREMIAASHDGVGP